MRGDADVGAPVLDYQVAEPRRAARAGPVAASDQREYLTGEGLGEVAFRSALSTHVLAGHLRRVGDGEDERVAAESRGDSIARGDRGGKRLRLTLIDVIGERLLTCQIGGRVVSGVL